MNHEPELVDEVASKQRTDESAAAEDRDILSRLPFEPGDLLRDVTPDKGRVVPLEGLFEGRRDDVLGHAVYVVDHRHAARLGQ